MRIISYMAGLACAAAAMALSIGAASAQTELATGQGNVVFTGSGVGSLVNIQTTGTPYLAQYPSNTIAQPVTYSFSTLKETAPGMYAVDGGGTGTFSVYSSTLGNLLMGTYTGGTIADSGNGTATLSFSDVIYQSGSWVTYDNEAGTISDTYTKSTGHDGIQFAEFQPGVTSVPEPASFATLGIGAMGLAILAFGVKRRAMKVAE